MKLDSTRGSECRSAELICLVIHLEENLDRPVVDETGLNGIYDWDARWPAKPAPAEVAKAVQSLGLELSPARRRVKMLVVREGK